MKYNVILMAHEQTKGMKSFGSKGLLKIKFKNKVDYVINHQLNQIRQMVDIDSINIITGFDKDKLCKHIKNVDKIHEIHNVRYNTHNEAYSLCLGLEQINNKNDIIICDLGIIMDSEIKIEQTDYNHIFSTKKNNTDLDIGLTMHDEKLQYLFYDLDPKWIKYFLVKNYNKNLFLELTRKYYNSHVFEVINESLKYTDTLASHTKGSIHYIKNHKHSLVR